MHFEISTFSTDEIQIANFCIFEKSLMTTRDNILKTLKANKIKLSKFGIQNVGLFGSYIRNEQSGESDIDLLIDF